LFQLEARQPDFAIPIFVAAVIVMSSQLVVPAFRRGDAAGYAHRGCNFVPFIATGLVVYSRPTPRQRIEFPGSFLQ
jgi:hypothetical protein